MCGTLIKDGHECRAKVKICSRSLVMVTSPYEWKILVESKTQNKQTKSNDVAARDLYCILILFVHFFVHFNANNRHIFVHIKQYVYHYFLFTIFSIEKNMHFYSMQFKKKYKIEDKSIVFQNSLNVILFSCKIRRMILHSMNLLKTCHI